MYWLTGDKFHCIFSHTWEYNLFNTLSQLFVVLFFWTIWGTSCIFWSFIIVFLDCYVWQWLCVISSLSHFHLKMHTTHHMFIFKQLSHYGGWSVTKVPFPCGHPNLLLTVHFSWSYSYLNVTFKFEHHVTFKFERQSHIWGSLSHLNVNLIFERPSHIWTSILHLNVNLTFECQSHIWTSISYLNVNLTFERQSHIWTSISYLNVNLTFEHQHLNVTLKFERYSQIWTSLLHLNVPLKFERHSYIWTSLSNLNVTLTFERQSHIWTSISYLNVNLSPGLESFLLRPCSSWSALTLGIYPRSR